MLGSPPDCMCVIIILASAPHWLRAMMVGPEGFEPPTWPL